MTDPLDIARALVEFGIPIFTAAPDPAGPTGGTGGTGYRLPKGWQDTQADKSVLDNYRPGAALCAVMGHGLDLLDCDPRSGGEQSRTGLQAAGVWPRAYAVAATPSGGTHEFVFSLGVRSRDGVRPGLDVKAGTVEGGRGFAFIAPTLRKSKVTGELVAYKWIHEPDLDALTEGDDSGLELAELVRAAHNGTKTAGAADPFEKVGDANFFAPSPLDDVAATIAGNTRHNAVLKLAAALRGQGLKREAVALDWFKAQVWPLLDQARGGHPYTEAEMAADVRDVFTRYEARGSANGTQNGPNQSGRPLHTVTLEDFAVVAEAGAGALLGDDDQALIAEDSDVMIYGDGGAGKTTVAVDLACHWATGATWLGIAVPRKVSTLLIENEGPRPMLRRKVARKLAGTTPLDGRVRIIDDPWAGFTFTDEGHRRQLADLIRANQLDVVIVGPLVVAGMEAHGTLGEVREFLHLLADVRSRAGRRVCFVLIHHSNRAGQVSGAWEGAVDTLWHCTNMGTGRTRLFVQKARWASKWHAHPFNLAWADNDSYTVEDKPELSDDDIAQRMLAAVKAEPGTGWTRLEEAVPGIRSERRRAVRDRLLTAGELVNIGRDSGGDVWLNTCPPRKAARLFLPDDPTIIHLRPTRDAAGTQTASATGEGGLRHLRPASRPIRDAGGRTQLHPAELPLDEAGSRP